MQRDDQQIKIKKSEMKLLKNLGKGFFGSVDLCEYLGNEPEILSICTEYSIAEKNDKGNTVIKQGKVLALKSLVTELDSTQLENRLSRKQQNEIASLKNEAEILERLQREKSGYTAKGMGIIDENGENYVATEYTSYSEFNHKANSLEHFTNSISLWNISPNVYVEILRSIPLSILRCQQEMHNNGVIHLDSTPRNFMLDKPSIVDGKLEINLKAIDFGLSQLTDNSGKIVRTSENRDDLRMLLEQWYSTKEIIDIKTIHDDRSDKTSYLRTISVDNDTFARKLSIIFIAAKLADHGLTPASFLQIIPSNQEWQAINRLENKQQLSDNDKRIIENFKSRNILRTDESNCDKLLDLKQFHARSVKTMTNEERLSFYILKAQAVLEKMPSDDPRKPILDVFLKTMENYLTTMPDQQNTMKASDVIEEKLLTNSIREFEETVEKKLEQIPAETLRDEIFPSGNFDRTQNEFNQSLIDKYNSENLSAAEVFDFGAPNSNSEKHNNIDGGYESYSDTESSYEEDDWNYTTRVQGEKIKDRYSSGSSSDLEFDDAYTTNISNVSSPSKLASPSTPAIYHPGNINYSFDFFTAYCKVRPIIRSPLSDSSLNLSRSKNSFFNKFDSSSTELTESEEKKENLDKDNGYDGPRR